MNKKTLLIMIIFFVLIAVVLGVMALLANNNFLFVGNVWKSTPEEALLQEADNSTDAKLSLSIKQLLDKRKINDIIIMTFVSQNDTLTTVTFVTNNDGLYSVYGYTEEEFLDSPTEYILNGDEDQFILFPYNKNGSTVFGWCYTSTSFTVNGITPTTQTYEFDCQGKTRFLDFWWINDFPLDEEITIKYEDK